MLEVWWIMYQSSHNVRRGTQILSPDRFSKSKSGKQFRNSRIFRKTVLVNLVKIIYDEYQCHSKSKGILNHVPKFGHCEQRLKFVQVKISFPSLKPNEKIFQAPEFCEYIVLGNIVKMMRSINAIARREEVCWIMYQSLHNVGRGQNLFKLRQVSCIKNSRILDRTIEFGPNFIKIGKW